MRSVLCRNQAVGLLVLLASLVCRPAAAQSPREIYLWGIVRNGCRLDESLGRAVEARLVQMGESVRRVQLNPATDIGSCSDQECAGRFLKACPAATGTILGAYLEQRKIRRDGAHTSETPAAEDDWLRLRLWKFDLKTQKTTIQTHACRGCNAVDLIARHGAELIESSAVSAPELVCPHSTLDYVAERELDREPERVALIVNSVNKDRENRSARRAVLEAIKRHLRLTHREVLVEDNRHGLPLPQLRSRYAGAHLLEIQLVADREARVEFLEQSRAEPATEKVECFGCSEDDLVHRVTMGVSSLLDRCYAESCRAETRVTLRRPTPVCAPIMPPAECGFNPFATSGQDDASGVPAPPPPDFLSPPCGRTDSEAARASKAPLADAGVWRAAPFADPERIRLSTAGKAMLGAGAASLATMVVVLASNHQTGLGQCQDPTHRYPDTGCQIVIPYAETIAIAASVTGSGLMIGGGILLDRARRKPSPPTR